MAKLIVDGIYDLLTKDVKEPTPDGVGPPLELSLGTTFKSTITDKIYHVAWLDEEKAWLVTADARYGLWTSRYADFLRYTKPSTAKAGAPGSNKDNWQVGDKVIAHRNYKYEVIATADKCVLLQGDQGVRFSVPNDDLEHHFKRAAFDSGLFG